MPLCRCVPTFWLLLPPWCTRNYKLFYESSHCDCHHKHLVLTDSVIWLLSYVTCCKPCLLLRPSGGVDYCDQPVCLCVCLATSISLEPVTDTHKTLCADPMAMARSSCSVALCCVLLVLWMTSRLAVMGARAGKGWQPSALASNYMRVWCLWMLAEVDKNAFCCLWEVFSRLQIFLMSVHFRLCVCLRVSVVCCRCSVSDSCSLKCYSTSQTTRLPTSHMLCTCQPRWSNHEVAMALWLLCILLCVDGSSDRCVLLMTEWTAAVTVSGLDVCLLWPFTVSTTNSSQ